MRALIVFIMLFFISAPVMAKDDVVTVDLAVDHVDITTGFNGAHLTLYGVKNKPGNIAVAIKGPQRDMIVRKKQKVFGVWTNVNYRRFENMPSYYDYAFEDPEQPPASKEVMTALGLGAGAIKGRAEKEDDKYLEQFQDALVRNKQAEKRFPAEPATITYLDDNFFKASFYVPASVPTGDYTVETFLFQNGGLQEIKTARLTVAQVGTSAAVYDFSKKHSFFYGLFCVIFAMSAGWVSNALRRS